MKLSKLVNMTKKYLTNGNYRFMVHAKLGLYKNMPDDEYLKRRFRAKMGQELHLDNPQTFNEKLQWLKLHDRKPEYTLYVDKYAVKDYIRDTLGEEYVIPTLGTWQSFDEIDFSTLPDRFVLKCSHDSGGLVIVKDKKALNMKAAKKKLTRSLKRNYYYPGREWPYKDVPARIFAEKYMEDVAGKGDLTDYKLHFFSGECKAIMVGKNRYGKNGLENDYYTPDWEHFDFTRGHSHNAETRDSRPEQMDEMLRLGKILAKDFPFVRVDFYVIDGKIYFGEITFFPGGGFNKFNPEEWDKVYGDWIKLPKSGNAAQKAQP